MIYAIRSLFLCICLFALAPSFAATGTLPVVASFTILADMTRQVGGERVAVRSLVPENGDAHVYQPTPSDSRALAGAALVIVNGLGFEGWIDRLVRSSGYRGPVVTASAGIVPLRHPGSDKTDPHAWLDAENALRYVDNIAAGLSRVDPAGKAVYEANATRYKREIAETDRQIRKLFADVPPERRRVVTSHDAFGYFGRAYGISFIAAIGINPEAEPSASSVAKIIRQIRREKIPAVFVENISDPRLVERIQHESGAQIGGVLYPDALSAADGPAATYLDMIRHNAETLSAALRK